MGTEGEVLGARILAFVVDTVVIGVAVVVLALLFGLLGAGIGSRSLLGVGLLIAGFVGLLLQFGYFVYFEGKTGQTPGKRLLDVVVVKEDGRPCDYADAAVRNLLRIVDSIGLVIPYLVGLIVMFVTEDNQRIGDLVADTVVVRAA